MSDSESEKYESADEEVNDRKTEIKTKPTSTSKSVKSHLVVTKATEQKVETTRNQKEVSNDDWEEEDWGDDWAEESEDSSLESKKENTKPDKAVTAVKATVKVEEPAKLVDTDTGFTKTWSWGGISSILSSGVSTITNAMGIPEPEELVQINKNSIMKESETTRSSTEIQKEDNFLDFGNIVSGVTNIGNKVITNGLDTLEGIGKKTMNILQENDPLLLNKRRIIGLEQEKPVLSQVLREAKEKSEQVERNLKQMQKKSYKKQLHFEALFDTYYGLVHLEALEMLSKQTAIKLKTILDPLSGKALNELKETLEEINELCDMSDADCDLDDFFVLEELKEKLESSTTDLGITTSFDEIYKCWENNMNYLDDETSTDSQEVYEKALRCLAETCALQVNKMHKIAEMILIKEHHNTIFESDSLVQMTTIFCQHSKGIGNKFAEKLNTFDQTEEVKQMITNIFVEVCNSVSYVQSAFKLFVPILQLGAV